MTEEQIKHMVNRFLSELKLVNDGTCVKCGKDALDTWGDVPALMPPVIRDGRKVPGINIGNVGFNVAAAQRVREQVKGLKITRSAEDKRQHIGIARKFASAQVAKIPLSLSSHIARVYRPSAL